MLTLSIYRPPTTLVETVPIDEKTLYVKKLMGDWYVSCETIATSVLDLQIGDYITIGSDNFYIGRLPEIEKLNNSTLKYTIIFDSVLSELGRKLWISSDGLTEFSYNGTPTDFVTNIVAAVNEISSGWTVGDVDTLDPITMDFSNEYCSGVLSRVAETFGLEFDVVAKAINLKSSIGSETALTFEYGKDSGLYKLTRQQVNDQNIITKCYGFGSTKNLNYDYRNRAKRLVFDHVLTGSINPTASTTVIGVNTLFLTELFVGDNITVSGETREVATIISDLELTVTVAFTDLPNDESPLSGHRYLLKNTDLYGVIEGQFTDDNIWPQRTGTLTASSIDFDADPYPFNATTSYVEDSSMDFDVNDYLLEGQVAKIVFKTGDLAGVECEIWQYDNANKRFYFNASVDPNDAYAQPNYNGGTPIQPEIGDTYTLVDIYMPQSYIDTAETALEVATQAFIDENSVPMVVYSVDIDPRYASGIATFGVGDKVTVTDSDLGIDALIRISGLEYPLTNVYKIKATIADFVPYTLQERIIKTTISTKKETRYVNRTQSEAARLNTLRQNQMKDLIYDTDGYFDTGNIRPLSIETAYLAVGTKSRDFWLSEVTIKANYGGDEDAIYVSDGSLVHLQIGITGLGYEWVISTPLDTDGLTSSTAYYLYAKCSKAALTGEWILSASQITVEQVTGYYHFLVGMLFVVANGFRDFDFASGMTYINGGTITTGKIQSIDGYNYFDLTNSEFMLTNNQKDTITLTGTSGTADITQAGGLTKTATFNTSLTQTATDFVTSHAAAYAAVGITVTSSGVTLIFESGAAYYVPVITNKTGNLAGTIVNNVVGSSMDWNVSVANALTLINAAIKAGSINIGNGNFTVNSDGDLVANNATMNMINSILQSTNVGAGDLDGNIEYTQANVTALPEIQVITLTGSSGIARISCNGIFRSATYSSSLSQTAFNFVEDNYSDYSGVGVEITNNGDTIIFTSDPGEGFFSEPIIQNLDGNLNGTVEQTQDYRVVVKRIDTITLTGESGYANILCDGNTELSVFYNSLTETASNFASLYAADYLSGGVVLTSIGENIIFTAQTGGVDFTGATSITNVENPYQGSIKLEGNQIWENDIDGVGYLALNLRGYNGGISKIRNLIIGDGRGNVMLKFYCHPIGVGYSTLYIYTLRFELPNIPTSNSGLSAGSVYRDGAGANATLKIV